MKILAAFEVTLTIDEWWFYSQEQQEGSLFFRASRPALALTHHLVQWVPDILLPVGKVATLAEAGLSPPSNFEVKMA